MSEFRLGPDQEEAVKKAMTGNRAALIRIYKITALIVRAGHPVPEAYVPFIAGALDGIADALAGPDARSDVINAVAPGGLPRGRPPKATKRLGLMADAANDLARMYPGRPGKRTRKEYIGMLARTHGYSETSLERVANARQKRIK